MPFLSRDPRIGLFVPRVTRVRRVFARVGASAVHAMRAPVSLANLRGGGRIVAGRGRHLKSVSAPAYLAPSI